MTGKQYSGRASVINALHVAIELPSRGQRALKGRRPGGLRGDSWPSRRLTLTVPKMVDDQAFRLVIGGGRDGVDPVTSAFRQTEIRQIGATPIAVARIHP